MNFKKLLNKKVIVWGASAVLITGFLIAANLVARNFSDLLDNTPLGGHKAILDKNDTSGIAFEKDFNSKEAAYKNGNKVTEQICEEGMILLKNEKYDKAVEVLKKAIENGTENVF